MAGKAAQLGADTGGGRGIPTWRSLAVIVGFCVLYAAAGLVYGLYNLTLPSDGWRLGNNSPLPNLPLVFDSNLAGHASSLNSGDVLVSVDGQSVANIMQAWLTGHAQRPPDWVAGTVHAYLVDRGGSAVSLDVGLERGGLQTAVSTAAHAWTDVVGQLLFAAVGVFVFVRVPHHPAAPAMLVLAATEVVGLSVHGPIVGAATPAMMFDPIAGPARLVLTLLFYGFYCSFWLHLFSVFPDVKAPVSRHPRLTFALIYSVPVTVEICAWAVSLNAPTRFYTNLQISLLVDILAVLCVVLASIIHSFRTVDDVVKRAQLRWLIFALVAAFPVSSLLGLANVLWLGGDARVAALLLITSSTCFPLAIAIAIERYRLFDIDSLINRALVYGCLTVIVGGVYFGLLALTQGMFRALTAQSSDWALVASMAISVILFNPLRRQVQSIIDRRFYRTKYDAAKTLNMFGSSVREIIDLGALCRELVGVVRETMQPTTVRLWLPVEATAASVALTAAGEPAAQPLDIKYPDPFFETLHQRASVASLHQLRATSPIARTLTDDGAVLAVPLVSRGELIGLLGLGPRRSGQDYSVDDRLLLDSLADQAAPAVRVAELVTQQQRSELARASVEQELRLARDIQRSLLPSDLSSPQGWRTTAHYQPERAVGGDFYDVLRLSDEQVGLVIGDVSNKGMPAALVMATVRTIIRTIASGTTAPSRILAQANNQLLPDLPRNMFVTCLIMVLNPTTGELLFATAGHPPPLRFAGGGVEEFSATGLPLGLMPGTEYEEFRAWLDPGDVLLAYTDGLLEGRSESGELFGHARLCDALARSASEYPEDPISALLDRFREFVGEGREPEDDITLLLLQRLALTTSGERAAESRSPEALPGVRVPEV